MNCRAGDAAQEVEHWPNVYKALGWIPSTVQNTAEQQQKNLTIPSPHLAHFPVESNCLLSFVLLLPSSWRKYWTLRPVSVDSS